MIDTGPPEPSRMYSSLQQPAHRLVHDRRLADAAWPERHLEATWLATEHGCREAGNQRALRDRREGGRNVAALGPGVLSPMTRWTSSRLHVAMPVTSAAPWLQQRVGWWRTARHQQGSRAPDLPRARRRRPQPVGAHQRAVAVPRDGLRMPSATGLDPSDELVRGERCIPRSALHHEVARHRTVAPLAEFGSKV